MKFGEIFEKIKSRKSFGIIIIMLAAGLIMIIIYSGWGADKKKETAVVEDGFDFYEYENQLEERLEEKINKITGVSGCDVILLVETSYRYDYIKDNAGRYSLKDSGSEERSVTESAPTIRGVAVICGGGDDPVVQKNVMDMLSALLGLPKNKIWVGSR